MILGKGGESMHRIELTDNEFELLATLLKKEVEETRVELHHTKNMEFRQYLREREELLKFMLVKIGIEGPLPGTNGKS
jgi:hypothetical protein